MNEILNEYLNKESKHYISELVDIYYQMVIGGVNKAYAEDSFDYEPRWPDDEEILLEVNNRPSGIYDAINTLLEQGGNINDESDTVTALQCAVGYADYIMTEFLINKGANPNVWRDMDEDDDPYGMWQNWYLDDIDIALFREAVSNDEDEEYERALIKTAHVLVDIGGLRDYHGHCLTINEDGTGEVRAPQFKY